MSSINETSFFLGRFVSGDESLSSSSSSWCLSDDDVATIEYMDKPEGVDDDDDDYDDDDDAELEEEVNISSIQGLC